MTDLQEWADAQAGVLTRAQCLRAGLTDKTITGHLRSGRWHRSETGTYVVHTGPRGYATRCSEAVLGVGPPVAGARETALWVADRTLPVPRQVHVTVPAGRRVAPRAEVVVHHQLRDTTRVTGLVVPVTSVEDAVLDIADEARTAREVEAVVCEAVRRRLTHSTRLAAALALRLRHRWRGLLEQMLVEVQEGAESALELLDLRNDRRHGVPTADRQVRHLVGGQGRRLDALLRPLGVSRPVVKELDGRLGHEDAAGRFRDRQRDNDATLLGRASLRYGWHDLADAGCEVAGDTLFVLQQNGYDGAGHPCGPRCRTSAHIAELRRRAG